MTSTVDKYEKDTLRSVMINSFKSSFNDLALLNEEDDPMFKKECVEKIRLMNGVITHLAVANNHIAIIQGNRLLRYDLQPLKEYKEVELNRIVPGVKIIGMFLDPTADFLMISFSTELLLFHKKSPKHKSSNRFKGHEITAVAWHPSVSILDSTSRPVLIGTSAGHLFEAEFNRGEKYFNSNPEIHVKELFRIGDGSLPITSLEYHFLQNNRLVVFVTTIDRLYHFVESRPSVGDKPNLQSLFTSYLTSPESFQSMPCGTNFEGFHVFTGESKNTDYSPKALGWLTLTGIYHCQIDPTKEENLLTKTTEVSLPNNLQPKAFIFSDFHFLLLCYDCIFAISLLSKEMVSCDYFNEDYGKLISISKDPVTSMIWIAAERGIFHYKISREDRDVWKIYTEMGDYELAEKYAASNPISLNQVKICQAVSLFIDKKYEESAIKFSETQCPVELVALKFLQANQTQALKIYLKKEFMSLNANNKAQQTMMVIWILDIILGQIAKKRIDLKNDGYKREELSKLQCELETFLLIPQVSECIVPNKKVIYDLMSSHGDQTNIIKLAKLTKDYEKVLKYYINKGEYLSALDTLKELPPGIERVSNLWYTYAPTMIEVLPKQTLSAIKELNPPLDPVRLLPALIAAETQQVGEIIKYLEFCYRSLNSTHRPLHNLLLSLYAQHQPEKLLKYIALQGEDPLTVNYDMMYAVRICKRFDHKQACVQLFALLGLWEAAMDLALTISVELAVQTASHIHCSPQLSRTLWLKIAKHVVEEKNDIEQAMKFLQQCELIKIEDILPFFSDFVTIDHFKDAICSSLQEYNQHIQDLKEEMEDASKSAQLIRDEINEFRSRHTIITTSDKCTICDGQLMSQPFYVFPCSHMFHSDCLSSQYALYMPSSDGKDITEIDLSSQCLYCGDLMIELINKPFINEEDYERIKKEWM